MSAETARLRREGEIIPPDLAIKAMRDSGYKSTDYALAELIDNCVQAKASEIEVFCIEERRLVAERERRQTRQIAVLDNGDGMTAETLRISLQFGNGLHLNDRSGIGRFGMGLPNSSISQCRRLDVWTWQNGPDNALHSFLDVDRIEAGDLTKVPEPQHDPVPMEWQRRSRAISTTGTLILWERFDEHRLTWRAARATLDNTEMLVGRLYRKFIHEGKLNIRLVALENEIPRFERDVRINDPLYLVPSSLIPPPFDKVPMFQPWGEEPYVHKVSFNGAEHNVTIRMSWARPETVPDDGTDRGAKPYGKHAAKNIGVSILRAGRELDLDNGWAIGYDARERWWGVEVEFPSALDEVFGVPNNKQAATVFSQMAHFDWRTLADQDERYTEVKERLRAEGDPRAELMDIAEYIHRQLTRVRSEIQNQTKGRGSAGKRHDDTSVEDRASTKFKERAEQGHKTAQDNEVFDDKAKTDLVKDLVEKKHYAERAASEIADAVERRGRRVVFVEAEMDGYAFFKVEQRPGGITEIVFNTAHPAYDQLVQTLEARIEGATDKELIDRIVNASDTLRMLFAAWARYEMEDMPNRSRINDMRQDWGRMARIFLTPDEE